MSDVSRLVTVGWNSTDIEREKNATDPSQNNYFTKHPEGNTTAAAGETAANIASAIYHT
jgi:hypothetical protein